MSRTPYQVVKSVCELKMLCLKIHVRGTVRGVGYLAYIYLQAEELGIKGYARYIGDDSVEIVAVGDDNLVEELLNRLKYHDTMAIVNETVVNECPDTYSTNLENFHVYFS